MKLSLTGSRSIKRFDFSNLFCKRMEAFCSFLGRQRITRIICGGALGIDTLAETAAKTLNIPVTTVLPDYQRYQRGAPLKRNEQIVNACDALLAVWNGKISSRGTLYTVKYALDTGKQIFLIKTYQGKIEIVHQPDDIASLFNGAKQ